jgi:hypothetical protein
MIALQAVTPAALAAAVPAITLAEARKLVAMVHRDEPVAASSAVRRVAADAVRAVGHVPTLAVVERAASALDPFTQAGGRGARRRAGRDRAHPARAPGAGQRVRQLAGRLRAGLYVLRHRPARARAQPRGVGDRRAGPAGAARAGARAARPRRGVPGYGRADGQPRSRARGDRGPVRSVRPGHRRARHHGVHVGQPGRHPPAGPRGAQRAARAVDRQRAAGGAAIADAGRPRPRSRRGARGGGRSRAGHAAGADVGG